MFKHILSPWSQLMLMLVVSLLFSSGCTPQAATGPTDAFREIETPHLHDDLALEGLREALDSQSKILASTSEVSMQVGPVSVSRGNYQRALQNLSEVLSRDISTDEKLQYIADNFRFFELVGEPETGKVLLTGYFEPVIRGNDSPSKSFSRPLYKKPADLVTIPLRDFSDRFRDEKPLKGRIEGGRVIPYYTRRDIDGGGVLTNKALELVWVDPIDAFFLQIQGSGTVLLPHDKELHLVYSDKNGHRYEAVGKFLKDAIAPRKVTMQSIESLLRTMPRKQQDSILFLNPSYVFFESSKQRAITSLGVPATPGRTIAADPRFAPKGALVLLQFEKPTLPTQLSNETTPTDYQNVSRFVVDQDSGGAITGTGRIDLFWGRGDDAKRYAGILQNRAKAFYLVPR